MTSSLADIARRSVLGAALTLALAGVVLADAMLASGSNQVPTTELQHVLVERQLVRPAAAARAASTDRRSYRYGWPVKPFRAQHPVRGFFGDPRISNHGRSRQFHFGVDVSAPNGTPVYATLTGRVWIHPLHATTVAIVGEGGVEFSYWHVVPTVSTGQRAVAYRTMIGRIEAPYGHVHFSEGRNGRYLNPLRPGAMGPFADATRPEVTAVRAEQNGRRLHSIGMRGQLDLVAEVQDETPIAIPRPWHDLPVMPALVRWRFLGANGSPITAWKTVVDVRLTIPSASAFDDVWAPGATQNRVRAPGRYRLHLRRQVDPSSIRGRVVEVSVSDTRGNVSRARFGVTDILSGS